MDISASLAALTARLDDLPQDLQVLVDQRTHTDLPKLVAQFLLAERCTDFLISCCSVELLTDVCGRILESNTADGNQLSTQIALASILPFASVFGESAHKTLNGKDFQDAVLIQANGREFQYLISLIRLLHFDHDHFSEIVPLQTLDSFSRHPEAGVRYLAARTLSLALGASDRATQYIAAKRTGSVEPTGPYGQSPSFRHALEPISVNYRFLAMWEQQRYQHIKSSTDRLQHASPLSSINVQISDAVVQLGGVLLPRPLIPVTSNSNRLPAPIATPSTNKNLAALAHALKRQGPILVIGQAGAGKTTLLRHAANVFGKIEDMITLHLNEQSDAKTLIGIYTTGATPGSFIWQSGVLTKAVIEGRWILIEDLERAPNEVLSVLLPLIERRELAIPGRDQVVKAALGFRILATIRTSEDHKGKEFNPASTLLGLRHWNQIRFESPTTSELASIVDGTFPHISMYTSSFMKTFEDLQALQKGTKRSTQGRSATLRPISPREVLGWAARVSSLVGTRETIDREIEDQIFLSALDCFAGFLPDGPAKDDYANCIAQNCGIDPQRISHLLYDRTIPQKIQDRAVSIGSYHFSRQGVGRSITGRSKTFSMNRYTSRQVERIAAAVSSSEPLLLVGETGTGKTTSIQYLADLVGKRLTPFNMSQQSESGDLLGGFKPINTRTIVIPLQDEFDHLFKSTFPTKVLLKNQPFLDLLSKCLAKQQWLRVCKCWQKAWSMVQGLRRSRSVSASEQGTGGDSTPHKRRRLDSPLSGDLDARWEKFHAAAKDVEARLASGSDDAVAFSFVEGAVVKAAREGDWVLLDEINLASPDTLEALADLFDKSPSIMLTEAGSAQRVQAHPEFRIFAAMNPATDVGKKDLPLGIRSRFTELYVESPERDIQSLQQIVQTYLGPSEVALSETASRLHQEIQSMCESGALVDGAGQQPHFSLRTLTRVLLFARDIAGQCSLRRALHEGFSMSYLTMLDAVSEQQVMPVIDKHFYGKNKKQMNELRTSMTRPSGIPDNELIHLGPYWLRKGAVAPEPQVHYIKTPSVQRNLDKLIRASMTRRFPILLQGPTSSGKTSMVEYLAKESGHKFVRINNHEHTDLQEYLGSYVSGRDGKLFFQEGLLVQAIREGHWIVLDELNLAPTDVLEALNRLLDDNRELLIPDTQEIIRPHPSFMIFATQNPAGIYGGRKMLSRAFRNRFLELHFDDIPVDELQTILVARSQKAPSWCELIVKVYRELSLIRQEGKVFEQKGFATLRDLFRWALRPADTAQDLAYNGFMLLAERCRKPEERDEVKRVIEKVVGAKAYKLAIDENTLYDRLTASPSNNTSVVWTKAMKRLYSLVSSAIANNEPVLLVGETGCGKTTVCQVIAEAKKQHLHIVNAHQNTETGDLIGAQRPARNRAAVEQTLISLLNDFPDSAVRTSLHTLGLDAALKKIDQMDESQANGHSEGLAAIKHAQGELKVLFEWSDGSLIEAMKKGEPFLLDEISLADDSVLERLNSVLEPSRSILLAEKGTLDSFVTAAEGFQFFATMNPGGDYGKKELSPALRNRFTEIWVPALSDTNDVLQVVQAKLRVDGFARPMLEFAQWFQQKYNIGASSCVHIRDLLAWAEFANTFGDGQGQEVGFRHGAAMVYLDSLGANPSGMVAIEDRNVHEERKSCIEALQRLGSVSCDDLYARQTTFVSDTDNQSPATMFLSTVLGQFDDAEFLHTSTTAGNAVRVARALRLSKPILIEGAPGVGKTTLVADMAKCAGIPLTRINLSEQTDLMDLFGSDVPTEGDGLATFAWRDASFLRAMKKGEWVLLDEMNLASQSILEGLNACLDHRGEVYIPELNQTFQRHPDFRLFAAQNPHHQGGGRKGLPASFVNRFTVVYAEILQRDDLLRICCRSYSDLPTADVKKVVQIVDVVNTLVERKILGSLGAPWEFNLRDSKRWLELVSHPEALLGAANIDHVFSTSIVQRFRTAKDRKLALEYALSHLTEDDDGLDERFDGSGLENGSISHDLFHNITEQHFQVGLGILPRHTSSTITRKRLFERYDITHHLEILESVMLCMQKNWPVLLVGASGCGKTTLIDHLAKTVGADLSTFSINADIDSMDLVGGYEQHDPLRLVHDIGKRLLELVRFIILGQASGESISAQAIAVWQRAADMSSTADCPSTKDLRQVHDWLTQYQATISADQQALATSLINSINQLISGEEQDVQARFEWLDGILIRAMQKGEWLVLDNANLCSPAALDRLNSLLEPNGKLIINEHTEADGQARVVTAHPNFRIILTMDPKHGELSRALRNRCVEVFMSDWEGDVSQDAVRYNDAQLDRLNLLSLLQGRVAEQCADEVAIVADHLAKEDASIYHSAFQAEIKKGLLNFSMTAEQSDSQKYGPFNSHMVDLIAGLQKTEFDKVERTTVYDRLLTLHPLNNIVPPLAAASHDDAERSRSVKRLFGQGLVWRLTLESVRMEKALEAVRAAYRPGKRQSRLHTSSAEPERSGIYGALATIKDIIDFDLLSDEGQQRIAAAYEWNGRNNVLNTDRGLARYPVQYCDIIKSLDEVQWLWWDIHHYASSTVAPDVAISCLGQELESALSCSRSLRTIGRFKSSAIEAISMLGSPLSRSASEGVTALWKSFRPISPGSEDALTFMYRLEGLARDFDRYITEASIPLDDIIQLRMSFVRTFAVALNSARADLGALSLMENVVTELKHATEEGAVQDAADTHCRTAFLGLIRHIDIIHAQNPSYAERYGDKLVQSAYHFAGRSTLSVVHFGGQEKDMTNVGQMSDTMKLLIHYAGRPLAKVDASVPDRGLGPQLLSDMRMVHLVPIRDLKTLDAELKTLGRLVATNTHNLAMDHGCHLHMVLHDTLRDTLSSFKKCSDIFSSIFAEHLKDVVDSNATVPMEDIADADRIMERNFLMGPSSRVGKIILDAFREPACYFHTFVDFSPSPENSLLLAQAWIMFSIGCIELYIPSTPYDPAVAALLSRELHARHTESVKNELAALQTFEKSFTGASTSTRIVMAELRLKNLSANEPPEPKVWRSPTSSIDALLSLFKSVRELLRPYAKLLEQPKSLVSQITGDQQLRGNLTMIKKRLVEGFRDVQDLAAPLLGFLSCLEIGLDLYESVQQRDSSDSSSMRIERIVPLAGAPDQSFKLIDAVESWSKPEQQSSMSSIAFLKSLHLSTRISPHRFQEIHGMNGVHKLLGHVHLDWKQRLEKEQIENAAKSSMYKYTGGDEVEDEAAEEEFAQMFPDYESNAVVQEEIKLNYQAQAPLFADTLSLMFENATDPKIALLDVLDHMSSKEHFHSKESRSIMAADGMLPLAIRQLDRQIATLKDTGNQPTNMYNIYTDPNIKQVQIMTSLVGKVRTRFSTIQKAWPEHATLGDVLQTCKELLEFAHTEPLMKIITKLEKLYDHIHEWQTVASKEFSAENLYNNITDIIVSWRQLELSTWSRMLDQEAKRCEDDAKAWFFVAYESIVAGTEQFHDFSEGLHAYLLELLKTLDTFFRSTGLAQYGSRLQIVETLQKLVDGTDHLCEESKQLLSGSLSNFLAYFKRFQQPAETAIATGRKALDADMKNVIQMASWKDRNILSLKQSAKTSHRKLFKVIRKFRALLNRPIDSLISAGVPDVALVDASNASTLAIVHSGPEAYRESLSVARNICEEMLLDWQQLPARFRNVEATVRVITSLSNQPQDRLEGSYEVSSWVKDTLNTAEMLRKATPTLMTEEGKATAQYLKSRKRGLFADVLKTARIMGFKSNLSTDVLAEQNSMIAVLTSSSSYPANGSAGKSEHHLHQLLHLMPQVRESGRQHNEDLTGAEVGRSIALIESMLHNVAIQRNVVSSDINHAHSLSTALDVLQHLAAVQDPESTVDQPHLERVKDCMTSLITVLETASDLTAAHFRLAEENGTEQLRTLEGLTWRLRSGFQQMTQIPALPERIHCKQSLDSTASNKALVAEVKDQLESMMEDNPPLGPLLSQVIQWTDTKRWTTNEQLKQQAISLADFQQNVCSTLDHVLAAIETVPKTLDKLPASAESPSWLIEEASTLATALDKLRVSETTARLNSLLSSLHRLPQSDQKLAIAFLITVSPIFIQYQSTHAQLTERLLNLHAATTGMAAQLAKMYVNLARDGFCAPKEKDPEPSKDNDGVEAGTGLGEGEGAEDISKDIGDDEDLTELAQEKNQEKEGGDEIEDEQDAVDMADQEMEGEMGEQEKREEEGEDGEEGEEKDAESEAGSVDDLGEGTVDEKMWDDGGKQDAEKEQEADKADGTKDEEMAAAGEEKKQEKKEQKDGDEAGDEEAEEEQVGAEEDENGENPEAERADPTMKDEENLDLPDDIEMEGQKQDDDVDDDLDMMDEDPLDAEEGGKDDEDGGKETEDQEGVEDEEPVNDVPDQVENRELSEDDMDQETNEAGETAEEVEQEEDNENVLQDNRPDESTAADQTAPSDAQGNGLDEEQPQDKEDQEAQAGAAQRPQGAQGDESETQEASGAQGQRGETDEQDAAADQDSEATEAQERFKKLGDAMEKWYHQQRQIQDAQRREERDRERTKDKDAEMEDVEFEHLSDEEDEGDTQALGAAREDEATAIDEEAGTTVNEQERTDQFPQDSAEQPRNDNEDVQMADAEFPDREQAQPERAEDQQKAFVGEYHEPITTDDRTRDVSVDPSDSPDADLDATTQQLQTAALSPTATSDLSPDSALALWNTHLTRVLPHSLQLQEQLRLILHPTSSTKLRGDFRTGKRLNIKRIIPYIASNYKRDKIWLRRSVPSKREYQIVIALDDSRSMDESGAGTMALDTVAMVGRALGMLEAGELSVVGFGKEIKVPVAFGESLSGEKGGELVRELRFEQSGTDVKALLRRTGEMFEEARGRRRGGADRGQTWQLMLIVGDGVFDDEEGVRRMERSLREQGVMVVFIIVDAYAAPSGGKGAMDMDGKSKGKEVKQSIVDLKRPRFYKDADDRPQVEISRYIETFPFRYYLIVRDVAELPNVLASALRQWFSEVAESG